MIRTIHLFSKKRLALVLGLFLLSLLLAWLFVYTFLRAAPTIRDIASITPNIAYCNSQNPSQTLDYYRPKKASNAHLPLAVYMHGGGWRSGDKSGPLLATYAPLFIKKGMAVAAINYRLHSDTPYPDQNNDIGCALAYLDTNADRLQIDTEKIIYFGDSAGGQLAAFAALTIPYKNYDYEAPVGVIDFYGVSDFSKIVDGSRPDLNARRYVGSKYHKVTNGASPVTYVTKKAPRFLFFHGTNDKVVPIAQSKLLFDQLTKSGIDAEYVTLEGVGHGFRGPELPPADYKTIQDNIRAFLDESINAS